MALGPALVLNHLATPVHAQTDSANRAGRGPWQPDGWGWRGQLGLLMPHTDVEPDSEFAALAPDGVSVIAMRVRWVGVAGAGGAMTRYGGDAARAFVDSPRLDEAVDTLVDAPLSRPQAIGLSFTGSSYVLGPDGDIALKARLEARARGVPIAITCLAAVAALRAFGARRVALIHPPWFAEGMDLRGATYFKQQGFDVVYHARAPLRSDRGNVHPAPLYDWCGPMCPKRQTPCSWGATGCARLARYKPSKRLSVDP